MRTLNRPMFRMGGPIKEGVMHGIREPRRGGGRAALVGNPIFPKDSSGRAHHSVWGSIYNVGSQVLPKAGGIMSRAWSKIKPTAIPRVTKQPSSLPVGMRGTMGSRTTTLPFMERAGKWVRENPYWTGIGGTTAVTSGAVPTAIGGIGKALKAAGLQIADLAVSDDIWDQDKYFADKKAAEELQKNLDINRVTQGKAKGVPGGGDQNMKYVDPSRAKDLAAKRKDERVNNLLEIMGYDKARKTAVGDALIDASRIITERGTLDKKNIGRDLINPIIDATSKRFDKPEQIREAVGLLMAKGEIEKDIAAGKGGQLQQNARDLVAGGVFPDMKSALDHLAKKPSLRETAITFAKGMNKTGIDQDVVVSAIHDRFGEIPRVLKDETEMEKLQKGDDYVSDLSIFETVKTNQDLGPGYYVLGRSGFIIDSNNKIRQLL